jgi:hypothetical protein
MTKMHVFLIATATSLATGATAVWAQLPPDPRDDDAPPRGAGSAAPAGSGSPLADPYSGTSLEPHPTATAPPDQPPPKPHVPDPPVAMPELLRSPTGWLLPAAVIYSKTTLDTGGGVSSNVRVGLGDVAEFGVSTLDTIRATPDGTDNSSKELLPYFTATFRMGVAENRLFGAQPGVTLGFEKSFQSDQDGFSTRTAELTLVASKHLGKHAAIHVGGAFWDAEIKNDATGSLYQLNKAGVNQQLRPFGGIQLEPIDRSEILIDLSWAPQFCYLATGCDPIHLKAELSWGVRYHVTDWLTLESGVRLPNIDDARLLDAQIFGSVTLLTWKLHHAIND